MSTRSADRAIAQIDRALAGIMPLPVGGPVEDDYVGCWKDAPSRLTPQSTWECGRGPVDAFGLCLMHRAWLEETYDEEIAA